MRENMSNVENVKKKKKKKIDLKKWGGGGGGGGKQTEHYTYDLQNKNA